MKNHILQRNGEIYKAEIFYDSENTGLYSLVIRDGKKKIIDGLAGNSEQYLIKYIKARYEIKGGAK